MAQGSKYPDSLVARVLAEAMLTSDVGKLLRREKISVRTYQNWRMRLERDERFAELYQTCLGELKREWRRYAVSSLRSAFRKAQELIEKCKTPADLEHINDHIKAVGSLALNLEVLDALDDATGEGDSPARASTPATGPEQARGERAQA